MASLAPAAASWDDQIVPTLRKRLESESVYLSNRLSTSQFADAPGAFPSAHAGPSSPTQIPIASARIRTNATALSPQTKPLSAARQHAPVGLSQSQGSGRNVSSPMSPDLPPSRIPTRPRSKSQLGARPAFAKSASNPDNAHPPLPSPAQPDFSRPGSTWYDDGRESPELGGGARVTEGFIKNELPPFRMGQDEAMRIAESGHDLNGGCEPYHGDYRDEDEDVGEKRKRSVTMRPESAYRASRRESAGSYGDGSAQLEGNHSTSAAGGSRSGSGGSGLGMGHPSSSLHKVAVNNTSRSASNRNPLSVSQASTHAPRSASLNMLASSSIGGSPSMGSASRLGVAAHFVPPETTYTPPKGANWDDVVLPVVAKKLGINENDRTAETRGEEGDLAVEWDRYGTPIKWVKRRNPKLDTSQSSTHRGYAHDEPSSFEHTPTNSAFSPTFERSPNNPLRPPSLRAKRSGDHLEPAAISIRTSPARTSSLYAHSQSSDHSRQYSPTPQHGASGQGGEFGEYHDMSRQSSFQRHRLPPQASQKSLRSLASRHAAEQAHPSHGSAPIYPPQQARQPSREQIERYQNPRPVPSPGLMPDPRASNGPVGQMQVRSGGNQASRPTRGSSQKKDDHVDKGCGCIIM